MISIATLVHVPDQVVDEVLPVSGLSALDEVQPLLVDPSLRAAQPERMQEVVGLLERRPDGHDLVHQVLHADQTVLAEGVLDDRVVRQRDPILVHLAESTLVDQLLHRLQVRVPVGDVRLHLLEHVERRLVDLQEDGRVDATQAQQLQDLLGLGRHIVQTTDTDDQQELGLRLDIEASVGLSGAPKADEVGLLRAVLRDILLGALEDLLALGTGLRGSLRVVNGVGGVGVVSVVLTKNQGVGMSRLFVSPRI